MVEEKEKAIKCLRQLRNLLTDDEDLKLPIHDERFLIRFVRAKKYDAQLAHETVRKYYTSRKKNPKIYKCLYPSYDPIKLLLENKAITKLKFNDPEGRPVIFYNNALWDLDKANLDNVTSAIILAIEELLLYSLDAQLNGIVFMTDFTGLSLTSVKEFTLGRIRHFFNIWQGNYPLRLKGMYMINEPTIFDIIYVPARTFMTEKVKSRFLLFAEDREKLHKFLPADILPEEYGGKLKENEWRDEEFIQNIVKRDPYYKELLDYGFGSWDSDDEDTYM